MPWPRHLILEITNACDLRCRGCHFHSPEVTRLRPTRSMPAAVWREVVAQAAAWDSPLCLQPWGMGEPLLHDDLWDLVATAKRHPHLQVGFYSNGMQWTDADVDAAVRTGLDWVCISVDGLRREVFEHYRTGASMDRVLATVDALGAARRRPGAALTLKVNMVRYPELADHEDEFVAWFRDRVDEVLVSRYRSVGDRRFSPIELPRVPCYQPQTILAMAADGRVSICCEDIQSQNVVGTFPEQSLTEIWRGPAMQDIRRRHAERRWDELPLCRDCDGWTAVYSRGSQRDGLQVLERTPGTQYVPGRERGG
ncbi:MAG: radical SAM/SPASM domain-containing protein [Planctomycetota bacterium]